MSTFRCAACGLQVLQSQGQGRPRTYCGTPCRRQKEYEVRRSAREASSGAAGLGRGGKRPGAGRRRRLELEEEKQRALLKKQMASLAVRELDEALRKAYEDVCALVMPLLNDDRQKKSAERAKNSLAYARNLLRSNGAIDGLELPLPLVEAKRLHIMLRRLCGYAQRKVRDEER